MSYSIVTTYRFEKELKRLTKKFPSLKNEFAQLIAEIAEKPQRGASLRNDCYKIRMAISSKGKGKSGGASVISYLYRKDQTAYLLTIYDKNEKADLQPQELITMVNNLNLE